MSSRAKQNATRDNAPCPKRLRSGLACAHCHRRTHDTRPCSVCGEEVCSTFACVGLVLCSALGCDTNVSCPRLLPGAVSGARVCCNPCGEIYCSGHRYTIRTQCQSCFGWLCADATAGGDRLCHACQTAPPADKDDNNNV